MHNLLALVVVVSACGTDIRDEDTPDPEGYEPLITAAWQLPAGTEKYLCVRKTVTKDIWIKSIRPITPLGTHHNVLMSGPPDAPDGTVECNSTLPKPSIYASAVGTQPLDMPEGVAIHLKPGDQLLMNLHLFNAGSDPLAGTTGIEIAETAPVDAQHQAAVVLAGKAQGLVVPPGMSTQTGTCTTPSGLTIFAVAPHMHLRGIHMKITYDASILFDEDYSFDEQQFHVLPQPVPTIAGRKYVVDCSYYNETAAQLTFGESTEQEMCYALTFVYPVPPADNCTQ
jgi:hypothetical protein